MVIVEWFWDGGELGFFLDFVWWLLMYLCCFDVVGVWYCFLDGFVFD